jgi:hypothetical protein
VNIAGRTSAPLPWLRGETTQQLRQILQHLDAIIVKIARSDSGSRQVADFRLAQMVRERDAILGVLERSHVNGGRARAATAFRDADGRYLSESEAEWLNDEFVLAEYERHAVGGRARSKQARRAAEVGSFRELPKQKRARGILTFGVRDPFSFR